MGKDRVAILRQHWIAAASMLNDALLNNFAQMDHRALMPDAVLWKAGPIPCPQPPHVERRPQNGHPTLAGYPQQHCDFKGNQDLDVAMSLWVEVSR